MDGLWELKNLGRVSVKFWDCSEKIDACEEEKRRAIYPKAQPKCELYSV